MLIVCCLYLLNYYVFSILIIKPRLLSFLLLYYCQDKRWHKEVVQHYQLELFGVTIKMIMSLKKLLVSMI